MRGRLGPQAHGDKETRILIRKSEWFGVSLHYHADRRSVGGGNGPGGSGARGGGGREVSHDRCVGEVHLRPEVQAAISNLLWGNVNADTVELDGLEACGPALEEASAADVRAPGRPRAEADTAPEEPLWRHHSAELAAPPDLERSARGDCGVGFAVRVVCRQLGGEGYRAQVTGAYATWR